MAFCMFPGDSMIARPESFGSFNVLEFQSDVLEEWFTEQQPSSRRWAWAEVMRPVSTQLRQQFASFCDAIDPLASALELQSRSVDLSQIMIRELVAGASDRAPIDAPVIRGAARMRECLNEEGPDIDLDTLAQRAGLSRFQALRAFKRRYGLPPHAYQICLRISQARQMLVDGAPAVDVAAHCGFADQSHLNRHFKRLLGVTPMQYARSHRELRRSERDPDLVIARSDH
jgi:AraC-like DNA-binding protein